MTKLNIKSKSKGFTIVELLVVIVVIGILAAITIVSYTGITAKANTQSNKANADAVRSSALVVFAENNLFPPASSNPLVSVSPTLNLNSGAAKIASGITVSNTTLVAGTTVQYITKGSPVTGICVGYWDYTLPTPAAVYLYGGDATTGANTATPSCS